MVDFKSLYQPNVEKFRMKSNEQAIGLCIDHDDTNESFSMDMVNGLCYCHACGFKANAYQFAVAVNHPNPREYIVDVNGVGNVDQPPAVSTITPKQANGQVPSPKPNPHIDLNKAVEQYQLELIKNEDWYHEKYGYVIIQDKFLDIGGGIDEKKRLVFAEHSKDGEYECLQTHKSSKYGNNKKCKWFLQHLFPNHDHTKDLFFVEGHKDACVLHSYEHQVTSTTTGCNSIPRTPDGFDLMWLQYYTGWIYIVYDHDEYGYAGAYKLANEIIKLFPSHKVAVGQWDKNLPEGFDIFDSFDKNPAKYQEFKDAVLNAKVIKPYVPDTLGRFKVIAGVDADKREYKKTFQMIETLMPENAQIIIGGTKGCNKSALAMQWGGSLACNLPSFLDFKINKTDVSCLYIDTEIGENLALERREMLVQNFGDKWDAGANRRFNMITLDASSENETGIFQSIEESIILFNPDVVFLDCLYNIAEGEDISKNHNVSKITTIITKLKYKYNITPIIVAHATKGNYEQGLVSDRIAGGSHLQNWAEHIILITESGIEDNLRLMRIDKSRSIAYPKCYYGIELDESTFQLSNAGIIENPKAHMISPDKKHKWALALGNMLDEFTTLDFRNQVECIMHMSDRTARNWLTDMARCHIIEDVGYGKWKKKLRLIQEEDE